MSDKGYQTLFFMWVWVIAFIAAVAILADIPILIILLPIGAFYLYRDYCRGWKT
jgi:hypothetical protein